MKRAQWLLSLLLGLIALLWIFSREQPPQPQKTNPPPNTTFQRPKQVDQTSSPRSGNRLVITVQSDKGERLAGASVRMSAKPEPFAQLPPEQQKRQMISDRSGVAEIYWPSRFVENLEIIVALESYAPRKIVWNIKSGDAVPVTYSITLQPAITISGVVLEPAGNPLPGAAVSVSRFWRSAEDNIKNGEDTAFNSQQHITGPDGRWSNNSLSSDLTAMIRLQASHSNYVEAIAYLEDSQTEKQLRDGTHILQLKPGFVVHGVVLNEDFQPIYKAQVWAGRLHSSTRRKTYTANDGRFTFQNVPAGSVEFTAIADGYSPALSIRKVSNLTDTITFQMQKGSTFKGVVLGPDSEPLEGVYVVLQPSANTMEQYEFSTKTDWNGRFEWKSGPNEPMSFYFAKKGYRQKRSFRLYPGENTVRLELPHKIQGQVLDSETEKPISSFTIALGRAFGTNDLSPEGGISYYNNPDGFFSIDIDDPFHTGIQVRATDYHEQTQRIPKDQVSSTNLMFKFKPAPALAGRVVNQLGTPVPGALITLVDNKRGPGGRTAIFSKGKLKTGSNSRAKLIATDASGNFRIESPPETGTILAAAEGLFGFVPIEDFKTSRTLMVYRFGRIVGTAESPDQQFTLTLRNSAVQFGETWQTSNDDGHFVFDSVPAGPVTIIHLIRKGRNSWTNGPKTEVLVTPGETTHIEISSQNIAP